MRLILADRLSAGAIAVLMVYVLLQGVLAGLAQGAMAAPAADSALVICASHEAATSGPSGAGGSPSDKASQCPCAALCQLTSTAVPAELGSIGFAYTASGAAIAGYFAPGTAPCLASRGLISEARAPPLLSI